MLINTKRAQKNLLTFASPPARDLPKAETRPKVEDTVELAQAKPEKTSLARRVAKMSFAALQLLGSAAGIGAGVGVGVGVATNYEVLQNTSSESGIYGYARELRGQEQNQLASTEQKYVSVTPSNGDLSQLQNHLQVRTTDNSITATLEADKAQAVLNTVLNSDKVQDPLQKELSKLEVKINQKLGEINIRPGEALFEANIPFPTGEGSLLQIAGRDIPVGMQQLKMEEVPLVLKHQFDTFDTGVEVELSPTQVDRAPLPEGESVGLHLLSARATASNPDLTQTTFSGKISLHIDDGAATRRALAKTQDPARRALLQERLLRIERIQAAIGGQNLDGILDFALGHRELAFSGQLGGPGEGMGDAKVHAWLTPDENGDGHAEVKLSAEIETPGLTTVQFTPDKMEHVATRETGLKGRLQNEISERIENKAFEMAPEILDGLRGTIDKEVRQVLAKELANGQMEVNALLDGTLDVVNESTQGVGLNLTRLDVLPNGDLRGSLRSEDSLKATLGPRATVRKQMEKEKEIVAPEYQPMVAVSNPDSTAIKVNSDSPSIIIPGSNARRFLNSVLENPETQKAFEALTLGPRQEIADKAANLPGLSGSIHIDVEVPFPGSETIHSPLGPIPTLSHKNIPIEANYQVNEFGLDVAVDARLIQVDEAARPKAAEENGVFIGAIAVTTQPMTTNLDGSLEVKKLETEGGAAWAETALDEAFEQQNFDFSTEVSLDKTEAVFYLWLTPDTNGDGKADVAIGHRTLNTGANGVKVKMGSVSSNQENLELSTRLGGRLNGIVNKVVSTQIENSSESLRSTISDLLASKVDGLLGEGSVKVADAVNQKLPNFYNKIETIDVKLPEKLFPGKTLDLGVKELTVQGDSIVVNYGDHRLTELLAGTVNPTISNQQAESGELLVSVPVSLFNRLVADKRDDGPMDWDPLLTEAVAGNGIIKKLKLATDREGKVMSPQLKMVDGQPTLSLTIDAQTNGLATPVTAGARKLPGFLGKGLGWVTDNTVGAVLGSRLRTEVQVPVEFHIEDGTLQISAGDASFVKPAEKGKKSIADFVPTRALSGAVTKGLAKSFGPKAINKLLADISPEVNPGEFGLDWSRVDVQSDAQGELVITVGVKANDALPGLLLGK